MILDTFRSVKNRHFLGGGNRIPICHPIMWFIFGDGLLNHSFGGDIND